MKNLQIISSIPRIQFADAGNFLLIAGPCVVENDEMLLEIGEKLKAIALKLEIPFILKASYRKANRTRFDSFSGIGDLKALEILAAAGRKLNVPTITDVHSPEEAEFASHFVDVLQIPAFLCRQTELLHAAARTGKCVNIKKGQFLSPASMQFAVQKVKECGNSSVMITERGTTFGYQDLVVDFRGIPEMQKNQVPVILDITHSLQTPNQSSGVTGGMPEMINTIARAGIAAGADGIFIETHPNPEKALSDGANMLRLSEMEALLEKLVMIKKALA